MPKKAVCIWKLLMPATGEEAEEWAKLIQETYPQFDFHMDPLSLSVACHIGQGALAIAMTCYIPEDDTK